MNPLIDRLVVLHIYRKEHETDTALALKDLIDYEVQIALDPQVSSDAQALIDRGRESRYPLPDSLYPGSKDWIAGDYAARVDWLHSMYESKKQEIESLLQQIELSYQAGRESMRQECVQVGVI
jgi:hypothetical protein